MLQEEAQEATFKHHKTNPMSYTELNAVEHFIIHQLTGVNLSGK